MVPGVLRRVAGGFATWSATPGPRFRVGCIVLSGLCLGVWVLVFLHSPELFPEGGWEGNAPWREQVPRGIRLVGDTPRYLLGAENLLAGRPLVNKQGSYRGYIMLVAACLRSGVGVPGVVAMQVALALLSLPPLYLLADGLGGRWAGALAVLLYSANPEVVVWHTVIQTDSVYISALVILLWLYVEVGKRGWAWWVALLLAGIVVVSIRPNGWIVPPALCVHALLTARRWTWPTRLFALTLLTLGLLLLAFHIPGLRSGIEAERPIEMLYRGEVLWGPSSWRVDMPTPTAPADQWGPAVGYIVRHPAACAKLAVVRLAVLFGRVRPSYSFRHNLFLLLAYPPLYLLALGGLWQVWRRREAGVLLAVIGGHVLTVALTFDHIDGRFFLYFLPELLVFSAVGAVTAVELVGVRRWSGRRRAAA